MPEGESSLLVVVQFDDLGGGEVARRLGRELHHQHRADGEVRDYQGRRLVLRAQPGQFLQSPAPSMPEAPMT